jgi:hypothetical protein
MTARFFAGLVVVAALTGCAIIEPPGPATVTGALTESVALTADRPVALIPLTVRFTNGAPPAPGYGRGEYGLAEVESGPDGETAGVKLTAIPGQGDSQPRAWPLGLSIPLPQLTSSELRTREVCGAPANCEHSYLLLITQDEPAAAILQWEVRAGTSFPPGTDMTKTKVEIERTGDVRLFAIPPTVSDLVRGMVTVDETAPLERVVRLRYTGPTPNAWPVRAEAVVRAHRPDGKRMPLTQVDLFANAGAAGPRILAGYVGPDLSVLLNAFDGCAAGVPCERILLLHFYPAPGAIKIDWEVELRVRDYESDLPVDATVSAEELTGDEAAVAAATCTMESVIDFAAQKGVIDDAEEAEQLARLAVDKWTADEIGGFDVMKSFCETLVPKR